MKITYCDVIDVKYLPSIVWMFPSTIEYFKENIIYDVASEEKNEMISEVIVNYYVKLVTNDR